MKKKAIERRALWAHQQKALDMYGAAKERSVLLVMPTGGGKTDVSVHVMCDEVDRGGRALFIAHRRELAFQAYERCLLLGRPASDLSLVVSGDARFDNSKPIQIGTIQTVVGRQLHPWTLA